MNASTGEILQQAREIYNSRYRTANRTFALTPFSDIGASGPEVRRAIAILQIANYSFDRAIALAGGK